MQKSPGFAQISAAVIGNALEWYDFIVYGFLAVTISKLFFPPGETTALLSTFAIFGVAFVVRPFGGIVLAHFADLHGRKSMMFVVIALMTLGIALIAFAPTFAAIGIAAPFVILLARLIQGLSAGGEFASATSFLVEHAPPHRRGLYGGWQNAGQGAASLLAGIVGAAVAQELTPAQLESWGWRIPFLIGLIIGPIGFYIRVRVAETPEFLQLQGDRAKKIANPFGRVVAEHKRRVLTGFGLVVGGTACVYVLIIYIPTYAVRSLKLDLTAGFMATVVSSLALTLFCPLTGYMSDRWGRRPVMGVSVAIILIAIYPIFAWLNDEPSPTKLIVASALFGLVLSGYSGPFSTAVAELFPAGVRATGLAVAYNLGVAVFGGFAPFIVNLLIGRTGDQFVPAYYVIIGLLLTLAAIIAMPEGRTAGPAGRMTRGR